MNINQMMRSLLGEVAGAEPRALELKVGQVVRGIVIQMMDNNEAVVQINGMQVKASLESPLKEGQSALLQVQSQSHEGMIVLKAANGGSAMVFSDTVSEWLKQLALPQEAPWADVLVRQLKAGGASLTPETASYFKQASASVPQGADQERWMNAAAAAFNRGLPASAAVIQGLQQTMYGEPPHELLQTLQQQLGQLAGEAAAGKLPPAAAKVQALLVQAASFAPADNEPDALDVALQAQPARPQAAPFAAARYAADFPALGRQPLSGLSGKELPQSGLPPASTRQASIHTAVAPASAAGGEPNWLNQMMKWLGVDHEHQLLRQLGAEGEPSPLPAGRPLPAGQETAVGTTPDARMLERHSEPQAAAAAAGRDAEAAVAEKPGPLDLTAVLKEEAGKGAAEVRNGGTADRLAGQPGLAPGGQDGKAALPDNLKTALLSLASSDEVPANIKETAQQLVHHITGQQLLLAPERNGQMFTHLTMYVPIFTKDGRQTASVQVQTRRGRRGELDADNCRLMFDLSMQTLGQTMVDVAVTDKIVGITLWNDHPAISALTAQAKAEIAQKLSGAGYKLLSFKAQPFPAPETAGESAGPSAQNKYPPAVPAASWFASSPYKGVDFRA
ncbi:hypothetical protein [Paenibacillus protaetiae]|uniref:Flagellar hook-length control protein FliK n=1 Tax=Paenibacillus protaetiae TaxID=2509456 RepID=A0A4P6ERS6_9BACL|nr:hypothetical protein [Paenibacillus protaetiae]QAY65584.1 hypothetical protein ET464_03490 [Paenibacillus protaetiae]